MGDVSAALPELSTRDLEKFWSRHYRTNAMAISYAGPASAQELVDALAPLDKISGKAPDVMRIEARPVNGEVRYALPMEGKTQANLFIAWPAPDLSSEDWVLWELAQKAIGGDLAGWWVQGHPPSRREDMERIIADATLEDVNRVVAAVLDADNYVHVEAGMVPE